MRRLYIAILCVALAACAGTAFRWDDARKIAPGMTTAEVTQLVGKPNRVAALNDGTTRYVWVWVNTFAGSTRTLVVDFKEGRAVKAPPIPPEFQD